MLLPLILLLLLIVGYELFVSRRNRHRDWFPELYANPQSVPPHRAALVELGRQRAAHSRLLICGLACNIEEMVPSTRAIAESIGALFADYRVVIFENNSRDGTRAALERWRSEQPRLVLLEGDSDHALASLYAFGPRSANRMQRMAAYRNRYLDWAAQHAADWDLMLVMDLDLEGAIALDGLCHSLAHEWDACAANGRNPMPGTLGLLTHAYDGFFLPADDVSSSDSRWSVFSNWLRMNNLMNQSDELLPVRSAFNGAALYKLPSLLSSRYAGERCEHTALHDAMRANGFAKLYLDPHWRLYSRMQGPATLAEMLK